MYDLSVSFFFFFPLRLYRCLSRYGEEGNVICRSAARRLKRAMSNENCYFLKGNTFRDRFDYAAPIPSPLFHPEIIFIVRVRV